MEANMIQRKLNKSQILVFAALEQQQMELQSAFQELVKAKGEQIEMLRVHFGLPEGKYQIARQPEGSVAIVRVETPGEAKEKGAEGASESG
jgi:hypothetical protein